MTKTATGLDHSRFVVHHAPDKPVQDNRVHIWLCDLDDDSQGGPWPSMSAAEQLRVMRLKSPLGRKRMARRFAFARKVIGNIVGVSLDGWEFYYDSHGKPAPLHFVNEKGEVARVHFSISHSENILALAILLDRNVGVDVEIVRPEIDLLSVAKLHLDPESFEALCMAPPSKMSKLFYRMWTRKEALAKLDGRGIAQPAGWDVSVRSLLPFSFECKIGKKEIIGTCACETLSGAKNHAKKGGFWRFACAGQSTGEDTSPKA